MVIKHNLPALAAHRQTGVAGGQLRLNLERLSTGFRLNRAADNAAGLAISEKMRGQIRGLGMAAKNSQDGVSMLQTAEGGLNETHAILLRMRELAVQSANGTYADGTDRQNLDTEAQALKSEIDSIAAATRWGGVALLDGSAGGRVQQAGKPYHTPGDLIVGVAGLREDSAVRAQVAYHRDFAGASGRIHLERGEDAKVRAASLRVAGETYAGRVDESRLVFYDKSNEVAFIADFSEADPRFAGTAVDIVFGFDESGETGSLGADGVVVSGEDARLSFHVGAGAWESQRLNVRLRNMSSGAIGLAAQKVADVSVASAARANSAIEVINAAAQQVSSTRAAIGAAQRALTHAANHAENTKENLTAAESSIRDTDMAKEMMRFTRNSIVMQASQAMLSQAVRLPEGILGLINAPLSGFGGGDSPAASAPAASATETSWLTAPYRPTVTQSFALAGQTRKPFAPPADTPDEE